jgi:hypothetical protein
MLSGGGTGLLRPTANLSLTEWRGEFRQPVVGTLLELWMCRVALGTSVRSLVLKGGEPFAGLSVGALGDMLVLQEALTATVLIVVDGVASVHLFAERWNVFHSMG